MCKLLDKDIFSKAKNETSLQARICIQWSEQLVLFEEGSHRAQDQSKSRAPKQVLIKTGDSKQHSKMKGKYFMPIQSLNKKWKQWKANGFLKMHIKFHTFPVKEIHKQPLRGTQKIFFLQ